MKKLDEYKLIGTHLITLYTDDAIVTYFDSFGLEHFPKNNKDLYTTKISQQIFIWYKPMIQ